MKKNLIKKPDSLYLPDYYGIEIKTTSRYSNYPLNLFTVAFDGPTFPEINRLVSKYGIRDIDFTNKKTLKAKLSTTKKFQFNKKYHFKLEIDKGEEKMFLSVYNKKGKVVERKSFIYLDTIKNHVSAKLNTLALVYASKKEINDIQFFRYYKIIIYKLVSIEHFMTLLEKGILNIELIGRISRSGMYKGRYRNKNLVFSIDKERIEELFEKEFELDNDLEQYKSIFKTN